MKKGKKRLSIIQSLLLTVTLILSNVYIGQAPAFAASSTTGKMISDLNTDKAMYDPGSVVNIYMNIKNTTGKDIKKGTVTFRFRHLEKEVSESQTLSYSAAGDGTTAYISTTWKAPMDDYKGYLVQAICKDENGFVLDTETVGVDVSTSWTKFPRYGYISYYGEWANTGDVIWKLKNYHINGLQYYDSIYRHHKPLPDNTEVWTGWSADHKIMGNKLRDYIHEAKQKNIVNMQYNMIYAATATATDQSYYWDDGIDEGWGLWYSENNQSKDKQGNPLKGKRFTFDMSEKTANSEDTLYFFNPWNKGWQDYIFSKENESLKTFGFDGWHGDTYGDWGEMKTADGKYLYVKDTYKEFMNAAKEALGDKYVMMNPVGGKGIENVSASNADLIYAEIWPWDEDSEKLQYNTYGALKKEVEQSRKESNGKSLIIPAYMQKKYGEDHPGSYFNTGAVILTDAAVYSAGGSRFELGDDNKMLNHEYFPYQNLKMSDELIDRERNLYDFIVAYENLLRDGQYETNNVTYVYDRPHSSKDEAGKIWCSTKADDKYQIIQMINLMGVYDNQWRNDDNYDKTPDTQTNVKVKYYYTGDINSVYVASPDPAYNSETRAIKIENKAYDDGGNYIEFTVPSLEYWDMIYMSEDEPAKQPDGELINGGFESGNLEGWAVTGTNAGVDKNDVQEGNYKGYFWSDKGYTQKIEQTLSGLKNGRYTVKAKVKQNIGNPTISRMELAGFAGDTVNTDIPHNAESYAKITGTAKVTNGKLNIAFHQLGASEETNLQIDSVTLSKDGNSLQKINNNGFESGNLDGWTVTGTNAGVNNEDKQEGSYKGYFYGTQEYNQKIEQTISDLENGTYTVTAMVKQSIGYPMLSRMELTDVVDMNSAYEPIPHGDSYVDIEKTVEVTNGKLNIAFYQASPEGASLQIDNVTVEETTQQNLDEQTVYNNTISNGGFENGNLDGWSVAGINADVNNDDVQEGNYKCYFYGTQGYNQKINQTLVGLENGVYTIKAMVKQSIGTPTISRMELTGFGGDLVYTNIPHGDSYAEITGIARVTNGKLNIAFYQAAAGEANLQIDSVTLSKQLTNGGFENGNLDGWTIKGTNASANNLDVQEGNYKCYFWSTQEYAQKIEQTLYGLTNGRYKVKAMVKQNEGNPTLSRMELAGFGGDNVYTNISHGDSYVEITGTAEITNGSLNIGFYQAAPGSTNLQIDSVTLVKEDIELSTPEQSLIIDQLTNSGFESGNLDGWVVTGKNAGADMNDTMEGNYKCYFWGTDSYNQKIDQTVTGLEDGIYTVKARVKQDKGSPTLSRMELTDFGGDTVYTDIPHSDSYVEITGISKVINGRLNIAFYQAAPGETNLQIDNVTLSGNKLINSSFENGNLNGWKLTGTNATADNLDVQKGNYKCYFWNTEEYTQKIEQKLSNLENGRYTVKAMVKQNTGIPTISRMELTDFGGGSEYKDIPHNDSYEEITKTVQVTNGSLNIAFYQAAPGETNLQIDSVTVVKELENGGFEVGNLYGWTVKGENAHVDALDAQQGNSKCYFWSDKEYSQKIDQTLYGLENGRYKVKAMVKQSEGSPELSRMELADFGGNIVYTDIPQSDSYVEITGTAEVTNGTLNIAFYQDAQANTNLQIDSVTVVKE